MGFMNTLKGDTFGKDATKAREQGRTVFVARLVVRGDINAMSLSVSDAAEMIEAVEAQGWACHDMSWTQDGKGRPEGYFLFRRVN
jgi:hypothetical protein